MNFIRNVFSFGRIPFKKLSVFITGGTSGIGLALAKEYLALGHRVGVCGRHQPQELDPLISFYAVDVRKKEDIHQSLMDFALQGGLDILIVNAGISMGGKSMVPQFEKVQAVIDTNIYGSLWTIQKGIELFLEKKKNEGHQKSEGQIVVISSLASFMGLPGTSAYAGSKAFLNIFTQTLSMDLFRLGIDMTLICPGFVDTPLTRKNKHKMPFLLPPELAAKRIMKAIEKKVLIYCFPKRLYALMAPVRYLPYTCQVYIMRYLGAKLLQKEYNP
jgi:NAD(P)-dependent dehydrogenase (short-subunit alcohol dehydrogenase family)